MGRERPVSQVFTVAAPRYSHPRRRPPRGQAERQSHHLFHPASGLCGGLLRVATISIVSIALALRSTGAQIVLTYPMLGMEIQNAHRSLLPCSNCRSFAMHDAFWPSGIQGLRHVAALRRDIGPHHEKQPCREHGNPTDSPAKTKVQARQGQSQSLIGAVRRTCVYE